MSRFEETTGLFGSHDAIVTENYIKCDVCASEYNVDEQDVAAAHTRFAGLTVCSCCYERVETAVLDRMEDIIPWYKRILAAQKAKIEKAQAQLRGDNI